MPTSQSKTPTHASIDHFMTPNPHCIGRAQSLSTAHEVMRKHRVRHLPVLEGGKVVGILSQRDLFFVETLRDTNPTEVSVDEAMSTDVYKVPLERPLGEVAAKMVEAKYGCAVVMRGPSVAGIFTTTDALRVLVGIVEAWR